MPGGSHSCSQHSHSLCPIAALSVAFFAMPAHGPVLSQHTPCLSPVGQNRGPKHPFLPCLRPSPPCLNASLSHRSLSCARHWCTSLPMSGPNVCPPGQCPRQSQPSPALPYVWCQLFSLGRAPFSYRGRSWAVYPRRTVSAALGGQPKALSRPRCRGRSRFCSGCPPCPKEPCTGPVASLCVFKGFGIFPGSSW